MNVCRIPRKKLRHLKPQLIEKSFVSEPENRPAETPLKNWTIIKTRGKKPHQSKAAEFGTKTAGFLAKAMADSSKKTPEW